MYGLMGRGVARWLGRILVHRVAVKTADLIFWGCVNSVKEFRRKRRRRHNAVPTDGPHRRSS